MFQQKQITDNSKRVKENKSERERERESERGRERERECVRAIARKSGRE